MKSRINPRISIHPKIIGYYRRTQKKYSYDRGFGA